MILLSHEHIDHYGCVENWKETYCPRAKVALTQLGWNYLRARPVEAAFDNPRPESIDMYLTDGQRIHLGNTTIEIVFTPGHSPGCVSFIIPVRDHGKKHVIGIMGGTAVQGNWPEAFLYHQSVEYFQQKCTEAKCDVGLGRVPCGKLLKADFEKLQTRKPGEPNPLVIGTEQVCLGISPRIQKFGPGKNGHHSERFQDHHQDNRINLFPDTHHSSEYAMSGNNDNTAKYSLLRTSSLAAWRK